MSKPSYLVVSALFLVLLGVAFFYQNKRNLADPPPSNKADRGVLEKESTGQVGVLSQQQPRKVKGAYVLRDRVKMPAGNASKAIQGLLGMAQAGDEKAALAIYMKLGECAVALEDGSDTELQAYKRAGMNVETVIANSNKRKEDCAGVGDLLNQRGAWLEQAASSGLVEAKLLYAIDNQAVLGDETEMLRNPQKVQEYKTKAVQYLSELASDGNVDAMVSLAAAYDGGVLLDQNVVRSYAYYKAAELAMPNTVPSNLISALREKLPAGQASNADLLAKQIYSECCAN
jgi:hypothetical protein